MAKIYVNSADGNDSDSGATWALAKAKLAGAAAIDAAGDTIYISSAHGETTAGSITYTSPGTIGSPVRILSVSTAAEPPTALSAGASIEVTGNNVIAFDGYLYSYGLTLLGSSAAGIGTLRFGSSNASHFQIHEAMKIRVVGTSNSGQINIGRDGLWGGGRFVWLNSSVRFAAAAQGIQITSSRLEWRNGVNGGSAVAIESGGTSPTALFKNIGDLDGSTAARGSYVLLENLDLSNASAGMHICGNLTGGSTLLVRNCKLPASWTGSLVGTSIEFGATATMVNCDNGDTNYKFRQQTRAGLLTDETTLVMSGGATDGTTPIAWKVVTTANCGPGAWWESPEMYVPQTAVGSAITVTVEILRDSATNLTDAEIWADVCALGTSGQPLGIAVNDRVANALTAAADQASSSVTWTTTGMSNPNKQKLSVSITPQEVGFLCVTVYCAKASTTFYINPKPVVS